MVGGPPSLGSVPPHPGALTPTYPVPFLELCPSHTFQRWPGVLLEWGLAGCAPFCAQSPGCVGGLVRDFGTGSAGWGPWEGGTSQWRVWKQAKGFVPESQGGGPGRKAEVPGRGGWMAGAALGLRLLRGLWAGLGQAAGWGEVGRGPDLR